ncbi:MAG: protein-L-isoaspartate(D-aspartate) O-methyltransferase [Saprospiraceae bacterium]
MVHTETIVDNYRHKGLRKQLVLLLESKGILDRSVLKAMGQIPRHVFLDRAFEELAYRDQALPIGHQQTISQPFTVAYQTQLLGIERRQKVLEIGTGSGYQAMVLAHMGARVFTIERIQALYNKTKVFLQKMQVPGIRTFLGDGYAGLPEHAPFDKILVTAGATEIPQALIDQLKIGGQLVIPLGNDSVQTMIRLTKIDAEHCEREDFDNFRFVPFLKGIR